MTPQTRRNTCALIKEWALKLVDKFTYLGSSVSSTENDIYMWQAKAWTAIGHVEVRPARWIKMQFFSSNGCVDTAIWMHHVDADSAYEEKALRQLHKNTVTTHKTAAVRPPTTHQENHPNLTTRHAGEVRMTSKNLLTADLCWYGMWPGGHLGSDGR